MDIRTFQLKDLQPSEYNPRTITPEALQGLQQSIEKFGYIQPLIVNWPDVLEPPTIVGGHQRLKVLQAQGVKEAKCIVVNFDPITEKAANVALNAETISGDWSLEGLEAILAELSVEFPEFEDINLDELADSLDIDLDSLEEEVSDKDADEVPDVPQETSIKLGDLIELGVHKVLCGDSTKAEEVKRLMGDEKIDMIFTDPPYGVSYADKNKFLNTIDGGNRNQKAIENDHMTLEETGELWSETFQIWAPFHEAYSSFYICSPQGGDLFLMMMMMNENKHPLRHTMIWAKNNHVLGRSDYNYKHEPILYGWQHKHKFYGKGDQKFSVWNYDKPLKNDLHPTMKPVDLIINAVKNSSVKDMIVADYFLGSGSTMIACEKTKRRCYGMEIDPHYVSVIVSRWVEYTGKQEVTINGEVVNWEE